MKMQTAIVTVCSALIAGAASPLALAQKGMGRETGVARQAQLPEVISLRGEIMEVNSHPCKNTTGRAPVGTHVLVRSKAGEELNIHLGPVDDVKDIADKLKPGKKVIIDGFRTDQMPENHFVAKTLRIGSETAALRDDSLRPFWHHGSGKGRKGRGGGFAQNRARREGRSGK